MVWCLGQVKQTTKADCLFGSQRPVAQGVFTLWHLICYNCPCSTPSLVRPVRGFCLVGVMKGKIKSIIYIDGENTLFRLTEVLQDKGIISNKYDIKSFAFDKILKNVLNLDKLEIRYYGTKTKRINTTPALAKKSQQIITTRRHILSNLKKQGIRFIKSGNLKVRDGDKCRECGYTGLYLQEKGVDTRIAVDMTIDSLGGHDLYLLSSDTDLLPAIRQARKNGSKVTYVGFYHSLTGMIVKSTNQTITLRQQEIMDAFSNETN